MDYFLLTGSEHTKQLNSVESSSLIPQRLLTKQQAEKLDDTNIITIPSQDDEPHPDIITRPAYIISDGVKELFAKYDRSIPFKAVKLIDDSTNNQTLYWILGLDEIECLSEKTIFTRTGMLQKLVVSQAKIGDKAIFKIGGIHEKYLAVRLDVAESLLRRPFYGLELKRISTEEDGEECDHAVIRKT